MTNSGPRNGISTNMPGLNKVDGIREVSQSRANNK